MSSEDNADSKSSVKNAESPQLAAAFAAAPVQYGRDADSAEDPVEPLLQQLLDIVRPIYKQIRRRKMGGNLHDEKIDVDDDAELMIRLGTILEASMGDIHLAAALFLDDYVASTAFTDALGTPRSLSAQRHAGMSRKDDGSRQDNSNSAHAYAAEDERETNYKRGYSDDEDDCDADALSHACVRKVHSKMDQHFKNLHDDQYSGDIKYEMQKLPDDPNASYKSDDNDRRTHHEREVMAAPDRNQPGEMNVNDDLPQEHQEDNITNARVSVSDDEVTLEVQQNLSSLRTKRHHNADAHSRSPSSKIRRRWLMDQSGSAKRFKLKNISSASHWKLDTAHESPSRAKTCRRSSTSDCSSYADSELDLSHLRENFSDDDDDDDNHSDKAVYKGINEDPSFRTWDNLFQRNNDVEPSVLLWGLPSRNKDPETDPGVVEDIASHARVQAPPLNEAFIHDLPNVNLGPNNRSLHATLTPTEEEKNLSTIPWTWLGSGFQLSPCGTGLILPQPNAEINVKISKVHAAHRKLASSVLPGKVPPVPVAHCGAVTALLSLVTALLYSGVTVVGNQVNCNLDRKPFAELSLEERRQEFPRRLADALTVILFVAAKRHSEKRRSAISLVESELSKEREHSYRQHDAHADARYHYSSDPCRDDCESMIKQVLQRQSRLVPVCRWELEENNLKKPLRLSISLSNIADLRSYILSNISQYLSPGGCALLLETLVHIYGRNRLARAVKKQRRKAGKKPFLQSLITCSCVEEQYNTWQQQELVAKDKGGSAMNNQSKPINPDGQQCLSVELLSLLLTGHVETNISNWFTEFGIGMLCTDKVEGVNLGNGMKFSLNPIWIVRGNSSYSVLWHKDLNVKNRDLTEPFSAVHWICSYGSRCNKSVLQVIPSTLRSEDKEDKKESILIDELELISHPDDQKIYPKNFQRWRFSFTPATKDNEEEDAVVTWIPYYRLNKQQKESVDRIMSSDINLAVWSRWEAATVEEIDQENEL